MASQPNVLLVFADQLRRQAVGTYGNDQVSTPAFDRLAGDGLRFSNAVTANPVCGPARASLLTGRYPHATGVLYNFLGLPADERAMGSCFADAGYRTGYVGKWHLDGREAVPGFVPPDRRHGFEYWRGFNRGHAHHRGHPHVAPDGSVDWEAGYQPTVQTDLALEFLDEVEADPFCLVLSWGPPHTPFRAPESHRGRYNPDELRLRENVPPEMAEEVRADLTAYYGMISSLDAELDRLLSGLDERGLREETIVCVTSDHGEMLGSQGRYHKGVPYQESVGIPLLLRQPNEIRTGRVSDAVVNTTDILPTLLGLCDVDQPESIQGHDLSDHASDPSREGPTETLIEGRLASEDAWRAIRTEQFLLAVDHGLEVTHLYDLDGDPYQQSNLANGRRRKLQRELWDRLVDALYRTDDRVMMAEDIRQRRPLKTPLDRRVRE